MTCGRTRQYLSHAAIYCPAASRAGEIKFYSRVLLYSSGSMHTMVHMDLTASERASTAPPDKSVSSVRRSVVRKG